MNLNILPLHLLGHLPLYALLSLSHRPLHPRLNKTQKSGYLGLKFLDPGKWDQSGRGSRAREGRSGATTRDTLDWVVSRGSYVVWVAVWAWSIVSTRFSPSEGISGRSPLCGDNSFEANINSAQRCLDLIYEPNRHTCGPFQRKHDS